MNKEKKLQVIYKSFLFVALILLSVKMASQEVETVEDLDQIIKKAEQQYEKMIMKIPNTSKYPRTTNTDGSLRLVNPNDWTSGFFPGSLWLLYEYTNKVSWSNSAAQRTVGIEGEILNTGTGLQGILSIWIS